jgi:hypothetical protein
MGQGNGRHVGEDVESWVRRSTVEDIARRVMAAEIIGEQYREQLEYIRERVRSYLEHERTADESIDHWQDLVARMLDDLDRIEPLAVAKLQESAQLLQFQKEGADASRRREDEEIVAALDDVWRRGMKMYVLDEAVAADLGYKSRTTVLRRRLRLGWTPPA